MLTVHLRYRNLKKGKSYYLDYTMNKERVREKLDIPYHLHPKQRENLATIAKNKRQVQIDEAQGLRKVSRTVQELFDEFLEQYTKKDLKKIKAACNAFLSSSRVKLKLITDVSAVDVKRFKDYLISKYAKDTSNSYFKSVSKIFKYATYLQYIQVNPFTFIQNITPPSKVKKETLTKSEILKLIETDCANPDVKRAFLLATQTGLGNTDCRILKYSMIKNKTIIGTRGKGRSQPIPLNDFALELIGTGKGKVFKDLPSTDEGVNKTLKNWVDKAEIDKHITFYCGRHTFATRLIDLEVDIDTIRDLLGHSSYKYIQRYLHRNEKVKRGAVDRL